jgi:hypothetical protein
MLLSQRIKHEQITIQTSMLGGMSDDGRRYRWSVALHRPDLRTFSLPDPYESNDEPTAFDVLDLVTSVCVLIDQVANWREWQSEYMIAEPHTQEWDERDKTYPESMYDQWLGINERLLAFLGHQGHEDYLYDTDRSA